MLMLCAPEPHTTSVKQRALNTVKSIWWLFKWNNDIRFCAAALPSFI